MHLTESGLVVDKLLLDSIMHSPVPIAVTPNLHAAARVIANVTGLCIVLSSNKSSTTNGKPLL